MCASSSKYAKTPCKLQAPIFKTDFNSLLFRSLSQQNHRKKKLQLTHKLVSPGKKKKKTNLCDQAQIFNIKCQSSDCSCSSVFLLLFSLNFIVRWISFLLHFILEPKRGRSNLTKIRRERNWPWSWWCVRSLIVSFFYYFDLFSI